MRASGNRPPCAQRRGPVAALDIALHHGRPDRPGSGEPGRMRCGRSAHRTRPPSVRSRAVLASIGACARRERNPRRRDTPAREEPHRARRPPISDVEHRPRRRIVVAQRAHLVHISCTSVAGARSRRLRFPSSYGARDEIRTRTYVRIGGFKTDPDRPAGAPASVVWPVIWGFSPSVECAPIVSRVGGSCAHRVHMSARACSVPTGQPSVHRLTTMPVSVSVKSLVLRVASTASWL